MLSIFKRWTPRTLLQAALDKLTPKNWAQGDFHLHDPYTGRDTYCVVGMATKILGLDPDNDYIQVEDWLRDNGVLPSEVEGMNDDAKDLESFKEDFSRRFLNLETA